MPQMYTAVIQQRDECWIGWIEEVPGVNCQEETKSELLETLKVTLKEALEFNQAYGNRRSSCQENLPRLGIPDP